MLCKFTLDPLLFRLNSFGCSIGALIVFRHLFHPHFGIFFCNQIDSYSGNKAWRISTRSKIVIVSASSVKFTVRLDSFTFFNSKFNDFWLLGFSFRISWTIWKLSVITLTKCSWQTLHLFCAKPKQYEKLNLALFICYII